LHFWIFVLGKHHNGCGTSVVHENKVSLEDFHWLLVTAGAPPQPFYNVSGAPPLALSIDGVPASAGNSIGGWLVIASPSHTGDQTPITPVKC